MRELSGPGSPESGSAILHWGGETLHLLPERALWWPEESTLFVADLHLGKGDVFRAGGIPIPSGTTRDDLARLAALHRRTECRRLVVLGDFFHGPASRSPEVLSALGAWRGELASSHVVLIRGNHDRSAGDPPPELGIEVREAPHRMGSFHLVHEPSPEPSPFELAGHLHPVVRLEGARRERLRAPCFWFRERSAVLPAFGGFTGGARIHPGAGDRVFVVGAGAVVEAPVR